MENNQYEDIINLPHHVSLKHPQMSLQDRAAQFSPFAALTGYEDAIAETERLTEEQAELSDNQKEVLDRKLQWIRQHLEEKPEVTIIYFEPDVMKNGGSYVTVRGNVKRVDGYEQKIGLMDGRSIAIKYVLSIEIIGT